VVPPGDATPSGKAHKAFLGNQGPIRSLTGTLDGLRGRLTGARGMVLVLPACLSGCSTPDINSDDPTEQRAAMDQGQIFEVAHNA
jgi:hypothetical protein